MAAFCVGLMAAGGFAADRQPTLRLVRAEPLTVRGTHFVPRERVRVTVVAGVRRVHVVRAKVTGRFTTTFHDVALPDRCTAGYVITASGNAGSAARIKIPPFECPPPLRP
jgi:hypothetical protein